MQTVIKVPEAGRHTSIQSRRTQILVMQHPGLAGLPSSVQSLQVHRNVIVHRQQSATMAWRRAMIAASWPTTSYSIREPIRYV